jgi:hypothetical protein
LSEWKKVILQAEGARGAAKLMTQVLADPRSSMWCSVVPRQIIHHLGVFQHGQQVVKGWQLLSSFLVTCYYSARCSHTHIV